MKLHGILDADSLIIRAGAVCQHNYEVEDSDGKSLGHYKSQKDFFKRNPEVDPESVTFNHSPKLTGDLKLGRKILTNTINKIYYESDVDKMTIVVQGSYNFRNSMAVTQPYKGNRITPKPILHRDISESLIEYGFGKHKVMQSEFIETDDYLSVCGWSSYNKAKKTRDKNKSEIVLMHIDKDIDQVPGWHYNYDRPEDGVFWLDSFQSALSFWRQTLTGDSIDNIPGIIVTEGLKEHYSYLKLGRGIGKTSADKILCGIKSEKDMVNQVVHVYKYSFGDEWYIRLEEVCRLLYLLRKPNDLFILGNVLEELKIEY